MPIRATIIVRGRVQRAGFKDFVDQIAFDLKLKGLVQNLEDGTVQVVCEGEKDIIETFLSRIQIEEYPIRVENATVEYSPAQGNFRDFEIIRDKDIAKATSERMDEAARYLRETRRDLSKKSDIATDSIRQMDGHMSQCFQNLDAKYGKFGDTMESLNDKLEGMSKDIREMKDLFAKLVDFYIARDSQKT
jgi:acylphosphatase